MEKRELPCDPQAEKAVLISMLLDKDALYYIMENLLPTDFYLNQNKHIFEAIISIINDSKIPDITTISSFVKEKYGKLDRIGGVEYLSEILSYDAVPSNYEAYVDIVKNKSLLRRLIKIGGTLMENGYNPDKMNARDILELAESEIYNVSNEYVSDNFVSIGSVMLDIVEELENIAEQTNVVRGLQSGFRDLDHLTGGFKPGELILLAARPSMGKTTLALNFTQNMAIDDKKVLGFFSFEMDTDSLIKRLLFAEARVDHQLFNSGQRKVAKDCIYRIIKSAGILKKTKIFIDDSPRNTVADIRVKSRRLKNTENQLDLIIVDYLQLINPPKGIENRQQEISTISRELKLLAKELKVPVLALSQLNRMAETRRDKRPMLSDLRESGALEQDADIVMFLHREEVYEKTDENAGKAELIIRKHRNGPTGTVHLAFLSNFTRFENLAESQVMPL